jgi:signal transduction histidine kinase
MTRATAIEKLRSRSAHERLLAARHLARTARRVDLIAIQAALQEENVSWVKSALVDASKRASGTLGRARDIKVDTERDKHVTTENLYADALRETTSILVHELEPIVGVIRYHAEREVHAFPDSKTKTHLDRLDNMLEAVSLLRKAASSPKVAEFDLAKLIREVVGQEETKGTQTIQLAGRASFPAIGDPGLLTIAIGNGLRNAIEAHEGIGTHTPIIVSWDKTNIDYWISIIDSGAGIKGAIEKIFDVGTTSKAEHLGMGLPAARQAIVSMGGTIQISPREESGTKFEIRWPRFSVSPR